MCLILDKIIGYVCIRKPLKYFSKLVKTVWFTWTRLFETKCERRTVISFILFLFLLVSLFWCIKIQISACINSIGKRFKPQDGAWFMWVNSKLALCLSVNICKNSPTSYCLYIGAREFYVMICFLRGSSRDQNTSSRVGFEYFYYRYKLDFSCKHKLFCFHSESLEPLLFKIIIKLKFSHNFYSFEHIVFKECLPFRITQDWSSRKSTKTCFVSNLL